MNRKDLLEIRDALIYHIKQTRPIQRTTDALALIEAELNRHTPTVVFKTTEVGMSTIADMPVPIQQDLFQC